MKADFTESFRVYTLVREMVISGEFLPGEKLTEQYISDMLNTSRYTVKLALSKIEEEGLAERDPYRGYTVSKLDIGESLELLEARALVEGLIGRIVAVKATEEDLQHLRKILDEMHKSEEMKDYNTYSKLNTIFHETIYAASRNPGLSKVVSNLKTRIIRYQYKIAYIPGRTSMSIEEHEKIYRALASHDPDLATNAMTQHVLSVRKTVEDYNKLLEVA